MPVCTVAPFELARAFNALRIVVERAHLSAEAMCCERRQSTAASDIQESFAAQVTEHFAHSGYGRFDFLVVQRPQKPQPIGTEAKSLAPVDGGAVRNVSFH